MWLLGVFFIIYIDYEPDGSLGNLEQNKEIREKRLGY
jgi:hypothetical protein